MGSAMERAEAGVAARAFRGRVVTQTKVLPDGFVVVDGDAIVWVGASSEVPEAYVDAARGVRHDGWTLLPGLIDLHNHGGGGVGFSEAADADDARRAVAEHRAHGTTTLVASLVTASPEAMLRQVALLADLAEEGEIAGIHVEGPFLARSRCGAQSVTDLQPGDPVLTRELVAAGRGHLVSMTVAPEVPGVTAPRATDPATPTEAVVEVLAAAGVVPSFGHTDASAEQMEAALDLARRTLRSAGARAAVPTVTHLFNAMRPLHHREPGPVPASLAAAARGDAVVELIGDGVHLADVLVREVVEMVGADGVAFVTDAMAAAGVADGSYDLGPARVRVVGGVARLLEGDVIAGGTSHLLDIVRRAVGAGVSLADAVRCASAVPARVLGRPDLGALEAGRRADLLVVDEDLRPVHVIRRGVPA